MYDRRCLGNNPKGNPNIAEEGHKWRRCTPDWKVILTQISRERSIGPRTKIGKLISSLNAHKHTFGRALRLSPNSMMGQMLIAYAEELDKKKIKTD